MSDKQSNLTDKELDDIRTNLSQEDVVRNMLEIAFYLAQWDKDAHEIDVKVKNLNTRLEAWMDSDNDM